MLRQMLSFKVTRGKRGCTAREAHYGRSDAVVMVQMAAWCGDNARLLAREFVVALYA